MDMEINQSNVRLALSNEFILNTLYSNSHWHKIMVENVDGLGRDILLKTLMKSCIGLDLIPVCYESSKNTASFMVKNCGPAIMKLCNQNLIVVNRQNKDKPFIVSIKLRFASCTGLKIDIHDNVTTVLNKRYNKDSGILNLENFVEDTGLEQHCALCQPRLMSYVLDIAKNIKFKTLNLSHNDIRFLKSMEALQVKRKIAIDLRNNDIKDMSELKYMKHLQLSELLLDGNPVCDEYDVINYGKAVGEQLETLNKLDGVVIHKGFLPFRRNFLCNLTGFDLVDQFLEHYFTLYDEQNRSILRAVYHKDALFSLTSRYLVSQTTSSTASLNSYHRISRDIKKMITTKDFNKNAQCLYTGSSQIVNVLRTLPLSEHDPYSFTVDLVMYTTKAAVLVVCGVFRERGASSLEPQRLLGFTRTFILSAGQFGEYLIVNDMLHVTNATTNQAARAFKQVRIPKSDSIYLPQPQNSEDKLTMAEAFTTITGLKLAWTRKCLEECNYDMKKALTLFIDLYKIDKIPKSAFVSAQDSTNVDKSEKQPKIDTATRSNRLDRYGYLKPIELKLATTTPESTLSIDNFGYDRPCGKNRQPVKFSIAPLPSNLPTLLPPSKLLTVPPPSKLSTAPPPSKLRIAPLPSNLPTAPPPSKLLTAPPPSKLPTAPPPSKLTTAPPPSKSPTATPPSKKKPPPSNKKATYQLLKRIPLVEDTRQIKRGRPASPPAQNKQLNKTTDRSRQIPPHYKEGNLPPSVEKSSSNVVQKKRIESIDLISSEEEEADFMDLDETIDIGKTKPHEMPSVLYGDHQFTIPNEASFLETDSEKPRDARVEMFLAEFERLEQMVLEKHDPDIIKEMTFHMLSTHYERFSVFEKVFELYYKEKLLDARSVKDRIVKFVAEKKHDTITPTMIEVLAAKCECLYGNRTLGENEFKRLILKEPSSMTAAYYYCQELLRRKKIREAELLVKPYLQPSHIFYNKRKNFLLLFSESSS